MYLIMEMLQGELCFVDIVAFWVEIDIEWT